MEKLYISATEAKENCDISILLNIAADLGVDGGDLSDAQLDHLENNIYTKEEKMEEMKNHFMYKWFKSDPSTRELIFWQVCPPVNPASAEGTEGE